MTFQEFVDNTSLITEHIPIILYSFVGYTGLCYLVARLINPYLTIQTASEKYLLFNYIVAFLYSLQHTLLNASYHHVFPSHYNDIENEYTTSLDRIALSVTMGYFLYDVISLTYWQLYIPGAKKDYQIVIHHIVALLGFAYAITQPRHVYYLLQV